MDLSNIITQMIVLFLVMALGYLCEKIRYVDEYVSKKLNILL